jgi:hypothetical protein
LPPSAAHVALPAFRDTLGVARAIDTPFLRGRYHLALSLDRGRPSFRISGPWPEVETSSEDHRSRSVASPPGPARTRGRRRSAAAAAQPPGPPAGALSGAARAGFPTEIDFARAPSAHGTSISQPDPLISGKTAWLSGMCPQLPAESDKPERRRGVLQKRSGPTIRLTSRLPTRTDAATRPTINTTRPGT